MKWINAMIVAGALALGANPVRADEPWRPAQVWLINDWEETDNVDSYMSVLNISGTEARVSCHVYRETGVRAERASQTKTYAPGASRSAEGGSIPCAFSYAEARTGWAVVASATPVIVRAERCARGPSATCTPLEARPLDCRTPAGLEAACRHAPATLIELPPELREHLRDGITPRPRG